MDEKSRPSDTGSSKVVWLFDKGGWMEIYFIASEIATKAVQPKGFGLVCNVVEIISPACSLSLSSICQSMRLGLSARRNLGGGYTQEGGNSYISGSNW